MAKRFLDSGIFRKPLVRAMKAPYKALYIYLLCECDHAGVWDAEIDVASMRLGIKIDPDKALEELGGAAVSIDGGSKWWVVDFCRDQYGDLNPSNRVHASVLARLEALGIDPKEAPCKPLASPLQGAKDIDKDKDKDNSGKERARAPEPDPRFEALWSTFDRYGAKGKALHYWTRLPEEDRAAIIAKAPAYVASTPGCAYRKQLEGWINPDNRLWERPIVDRAAADKPKGPMTYAEARAKLEAIRAANGIAPGGYLPTNLIPAEVREAMQRQTA